MRLAKMHAHARLRQHHKMPLFLTAVAATLLVVATVGTLLPQFHLRKHVAAPTDRVGDLPWAADEPQRTDMNGFAGLVSVRSGSASASLFYWFFPAQEPLEEHPPLVLWLQGGPGASSAIGLFFENGPMQIEADPLASEDNPQHLRLRTNPNSWNKHYGMLFVDSPAGTGFSLVQGSPKTHSAADLVQTRTAAAINATNTNESDKDAALLSKSQECISIRSSICGFGDALDEPPKFVDGFASNQAAVAQDLISLLDRFYEMHPNQLKSRLFVTGESYAGKYVPNLAWHIHAVNQHRSAAKMISNGNKVQPTIPLSGIAIGNGLTDPITQVAYHAPQALALGLVSTDQAEIMSHLTDVAIGYACKRDWLHSLSARLRMFDFFRNVTGGINWYDVRKSDRPNSWSRMNAFLRRSDVKHALNLNKEIVFANDPGVFDHLSEDIMKSAAGAVAAVLEAGYRVLLYQGQFDFRDGILASSEWIEGLAWHGRDGFRQSERQIWRAPVSQQEDKEEHVVGFVREYQNLVRVEILNAGHLVPMDQGFVSRLMISKMLVDA